MKYLIIIVSLAFLLAGCTKHKIKNKCCEEGIEIIPSDYNSDSVTIWAPQLFTPNGDGINDLFSLKGIGWSMRSMRIEKGLSKVFDTNTPTDQWNGAVKGKVKDGYYKYNIVIKTKHDELLMVTGNVCAFTYNKKRLVSAEEDRYCDCSTADMIDPVQGFIYSKGNECN